MMKDRDAVSLTKKLIGFNTMNPPGNELKLAEFIGQILEEIGFSVDYIPYEKDRMHVVARSGHNSNSPALVLSGHLDTVRTMHEKWDSDPFTGKERDGKLFGLGASDMKSGIAAMIVAAAQAVNENSFEGNIVFLFTSGEENGCQGAEHLVTACPAIENARGIIVGEPTSNIPSLGHKGGLYLKMHTRGVAAHSSMPHLGENAIYKAAEAILKIREYDFGVGKDDLLGLPTVNIGLAQGGVSINSVPDFAEFTADFRTTPETEHDRLVADLQTLLGDAIRIEKLVDLKAVKSNFSDHFVKKVFQACGVDSGNASTHRSMPYLTDGSVLQPFFKMAPTIILGPGLPERAHTINEYCYIENIHRAVTIYKEIIMNYNNDN